MSLRTDIEAEVATIFRDSWSERDGVKVPETEDLTLGNDGVKLTATVLYADLADSTALVDGYEKKFAAEIYKTFLHCAAKIVRSESGVVTAYDGDRLMAVFLGDSKNTSAVRAAMKIRWARDEIIAPALKRQYPTSTYELKHVVGIDTSELLVARTGVRGANDLVWVGRAANHAAKLAALPDSRSTYISADIFGNMHESVKFAENGKGSSMWEKLSWNTFDNRTIYGSTWRWSV